MAKRKKSRSRKGMGSVFGVNVAKGLAAVMYGMVRGGTSRKLAPLTSKIPAGAISDELGMLAVTTLSKKFLFKRAGLLRDAATLGQGIELARIGDAVINGEVNLGFLGGNNGNGNNGVGSMLMPTVG